MHCFNRCLFVDAERWANLNGGSPKPDWRKHKKAFLNGLADDRLGEFAVRFLATRLHHMKAGYQAHPVMRSCRGRILILEASKLAVHDSANLEGVLRKILAHNDLQVCQGCGRA